MVPTGERPPQTSRQLPPPDHEMEHLVSERPHAPDLNAVRNLFYEAQRSGVSYPTDPRKQVTVGKDAGIRVGESPDINPTLSRVQHGTFAASRTEIEAHTVRTKLPDNTRPLRVAELEGWAYGFYTELSDYFELFAYYDGARYQVMLIAPELEGHVGAHSAHLYPDGRLCLSADPGMASGQPSLEEAYSKSVLWANGISIYQRGHAFPWSINNL